MEIKQQRQTVPDDEQSNKRSMLRSTFWTGIMPGIGIMAFLDETLLHQLLQWMVIDKTL